MEPLTPLDTLCRIILRAKEYEAQVPTDYDGGEAPENVDDEGSGETLSVLDDSINTSVEEELIASLEDLADDQQAERRERAELGEPVLEHRGRRAWVPHRHGKTHGVEWTRCRAQTVSCFDCLSPLR